MNKEIVKLNCRCSAQTKYECLGYEHCYNLCERVRWNSWGDVADVGLDPPGPLAFNTKGKLAPVK